jgi:2-phosphoglycerate kinase
MVLEGVHLVPGMLRLDDCPALVVQCVLAIEDEAEHADHFWVRDGTTDGLRPVQKYLDRFSDIRRLQDFIVSRAEQHGVPVVSERQVNGTVAAVIDLVLASAEERLEPV